MAKSREIKKRMRAVRNIQRITRTMQMIATSKFSRAQQAASASQPYTRGLADLVGRLAAGADGLDHPLLQVGDREGLPELTLVITSERGLCGPYNANLLRAAITHFREHEAARDGRVEVIGKKGATALDFNKIPIACRHTQFGDQPTFGEVEALAQSYIDSFSAGEVSLVRVISMEYISAGRQAPRVMQLLPFATSHTGAPNADQAGEAFAEPAAGSEGRYVEPPPEFSPSADQLLGDLLPAAVKAMLFQAMNDAIVSEHIARMIAMKAATDNAGKMRKALSRRYNRARQAQITTELNEIVSGAAALG